MFATIPIFILTVFYFVTCFIVFCASVFILRNIFILFISLYARFPEFFVHSVVLCC